MHHRKTPLSETGRLRLARCVVEEGYPLRRAAERFNVSVTTAQRWANRYRAEGEAGMCGRSSRPHSSPRRTLTRTERRIIKLRVGNDLVRDSRRAHDAWHPAWLRYRIVPIRTSMKTIRCLAIQAPDAAR
jgi:transposase